ncbi:uncharacterized protein UMAG_02232 [Mycosarcoma maydis]|uniref:Uncharacterized protein n=1 Tax=Mycosarcoma maydis TaxID=5270 RepID=A0A0D1E0G3_MYCMD|nr:uncharacterized protein UMAG_02232 [Ustilago maydis 521]KIS69704.1 hypothetical protein UMAG_02232 [Ustilago maydis 521]|eukprot:XP_011388573.1 hypothetical protein UMAG_02232 [Ustilago maydis 521]
MPFVEAAKDMIGAAAADANTHEDAPNTIISLSWAFLIIPCIFLVVVFAWIMYHFSEPSEFAPTNGLGHAEHDADDHDDQSNDEKQQLLDAFKESQSHSTHSITETEASSSSWKINSKFSTTSRGGSVYSSYPDSNGIYTHTSEGFISPSKSNQSGLNLDAKPNRPVGSKAAKVLALNRERMMQDLDILDPIDRDQLRRSSSRASDTRKAD